MDPRYSRMLSHELVVTSLRRRSPVTTCDMIMVGLLGAHGRTEDEWGDLVIRASLKVVKIWPGPDGAESVIEAELA